MDGGGGYTAKEAIATDIGKMAGIPEAQEIGRFQRRLSGSERDAMYHSGDGHISEQRVTDSQDRYMARLVEQMGPEMNQGGGYTPKEASSPYGSMSGIKEAAEIGRERRLSIEDVYGHGTRETLGSGSVSQEEADRRWKMGLRNPVAGELDRSGKCLLRIP
jgi:hypothetical protein